MNKAWRIAPAIVAVWAAGVGETRATAPPPPPAGPAPEPVAVVYLGKGLPLPVWATAVATPLRFDPPTSANAGKTCSVLPGGDKQVCTTSAAKDGPQCSTLAEYAQCSIINGTSSVCSAFVKDTQCSVFATFATCSIDSGSDNRCSVMNVKKTDGVVGGRTCSTNAGSSFSACSVYNDPSGFCSTGQGSDGSSCSVTGGNDNYCSIFDDNQAAGATCSIKNNPTGKCSVLAKDAGNCSVRENSKGECTVFDKSGGMCSTWNNKEKIKCSVVKAGGEVEGPTNGKCKGKG